MNSLSSAGMPPSRPRRRKRGGWTLRLTGGGVVLLLVANLVVLGLAAWPVLRARLALPTLVVSHAAALTPSPSDSPTPIPSISPTALPSETPLAPPASLTPLPAAPYPLSPDLPEAPPGLVVLSLAEGLDAHLFAYQPQAIPLTRLTDGPWDDVSPALSPDGKRLAFASNRSGYWDLYLLALDSGEITRLTDSLDYDGAPSWSPDGRWIVHETYVAGNGGGLDLIIRSVEGEQDPIRLTEDPAADYSPAWSPQGRQVAFISNRSGEAEVWLADLDQVGEGRFTNISRKAQALEAHPAWSPDGSSLAWASVENGFHHLIVWGPGGTEIRSPGSGDWPVWSPDGKQLLTVLLDPNRAYLAAYPADGGGLAWPPIELPGDVQGIAWGNESGDVFPVEVYEQAAHSTPARLWAPVLTPAEDIPGGRGRLVELADVEAPYPMLSDAVDEAFAALRKRLAEEIGWDFLSSLENAYVPLTDALDPGMGNDWLYTGRAFAFTSVPLSAGWMVVAREDFGLETYWRVYLRARFQDGSAGAPLAGQPWDFSARYNGDPAAYEQGGLLAGAIPPGYWVDFTRFAQAFGWERLPALLQWRYAFPASRLNEYVFTGGLDWRSAMLDLYPPEALITPTALVPPTRTPSPTPRWYRTPTPTSTSTPRPTLTPVLPTPTPTVTPAASATSRPTQTRTLPPKWTATPTP